MKRILFSIMFAAIAIGMMACAAPVTSRVTTGNALFDSAPRPAAAPTVALAPSAQKATAPGIGGGVAESAPAAASTERMIVYTVSLRIEVQDTEKSVADITAITSQFKGYVGGSNLNRDSNGRMRGTISLNIPAESLDAAQNKIEATGLKVLSRNRSSSDVTDKYTDLGARMKNLTAAEDELRKMMDSIREKSNKAEDILAVYKQLTDIRTQIEQIKGQMNVLEKTSTYATMTVELVPHEEVQVLQPDTWMPDNTAKQALRSLVQTLQRIGDLTIWLVLFFLPVVIVLLLPLFILVLILRAWLARRKKSKLPEA
jgi:hypothetical protein